MNADNPARRGNGSVMLWFVRGEWRAHPLRMTVAVLAVALGIALGFAVHLINAAALNEFSAAAKSISGQSDLQVHGVEPYFDESLYPMLARRNGVAIASPVLEIDAIVPGEKRPLRIFGLDVFRAAAVSPDLIGIPAEDRRLDMLADDTIFLSPAATEWLRMKPGMTLQLRAGTQTVALRVAGGLARARPGQRIAVMDIGAAQWRFGQVGRLSQIDLKLMDGVDRMSFKNALTREAQGKYLVAEIEDQESRTADMSRAYRVNLNVLALIALFTGAFLVFSTQALSVMRRHQQFALLRVVGLTRGQLLAQILAEGAAIGFAGSLAGLAGGYMVAAAALHFFGSDLGGGFFPGVKPEVQFAPGAALIFLLLGPAVATLGSLGPALNAVRSQPAQALKAGGGDAALSRLSSPWPALACLACGLALSRMPPLFGLPISGYLAVALLLVGGIALMPRLSALFFSLFNHAPGAIMTLTLARLKNAPNQAAIALGGILASFSLMVAMGIMVTSFRVSVDDWLRQLLVADLYVRSTAASETSLLSAAEQQRIASVPGVSSAAFLRTFPLNLDPAKPTVILIAREIDAAAPENTLPMVEQAPASALHGGAVPIWISEAMVDIHRYSIGREIALPLQGKPGRFVVAGIWRDYARQSGSIQMRLDDYRKLTGDMDINDAALHIQPGVPVTQVIESIRKLPFGGKLELSEPSEIRAVSLKIFDRSFAVTYVLEAVAIVIGLFGVAATFSGQTLARAKEFGMLRHIGVTRRQILAILAVEGGLLTGIGIAFGFLLGCCISLILVYVVNPQSFHWSMQFHMPWQLIVSVASVLLASAVATALLAGRHATSGSAVRAVREDW